MSDSRTLTNMKKAIFLAIAVASLAILPTAAQAVPIAGDLSLSGSVRVTATAIEWVQASSGFDFIVIDDTNSDFFDYLAFTFGDAIDLSAVAQPAGLPFPGGPLPNFLTFEEDAGLTFTLESISPCDTSSCFFPGTPFNYLQTTNSSGGVDTAIQMSMSGTVSDTTPNDPGDTTDPSNWLGSWTATFQGESVDQLRARFLLAGQITDEYDAELSVTLIPTQVIPEPATLLTFGLGTAVLAARRRRQAKRNNQ